MRSRLLEETEWREGRIYESKKIVQQVGIPGTLTGAQQDVEREKNGGLQKMPLGKASFLTWIGRREGEAAIGSPQKAEG